MVATCPQCTMSLSFDDQRLPTEPFNVMCPRCRQSVTIMPPAKEEPKLPGSAPDALAQSRMISHAPVSQAELLKVLAEMLSAATKSPQSNRIEADRWRRRCILICIEDTQLRDKLRAALDPTQYEIFSADFAPEAIEILHESGAEVIVLSPGFDPDHQGGATMMQYINRLTPQARRRTYVVLISPQLRTLDTYLAFANGVNLTVHPEDIESFQTIFERSVRDFNDLYRPLYQAMSVDPF
jgi:PleD family two-component response regulator